ncbi:unnamed protein product [Gongylonema pulchrum]|uniref:Small ribosomal subunit protein mS26 n=1 Tax=Gongylonema pulchrum TaxID=637853 RepID=A0A183CZZ4_9BILA|nr:unnamed protein product [Gongylonema pulchrum]
MRPDDVRELLWRRHAYNNAIISLRRHFKQEYKMEQLVREEKEEFDRLLAENEERNRMAAEKRAEREKVAMEKMEMEYIRSIEEELQRREVNVKQKKQEVLEMVAKSKHFITEDILDEKLEEALENPVVYDYAVDLMGNKYYAPIPEKYVKGTPPRQKGRTYDITLGIEHYSKIVPYSATGADGNAEISPESGESMKQQA